MFTGFFGTYQHNLDDKGRLMIPAAYRALLVGNAFITKGFDNCLMVMTETYFNQVYERIQAMNVADPTARMLRRLILANAYPVETDKIGRILLPQNLRTLNSIQSGELVLLGQGEYFEIWTPDMWRTEEEKTKDAEANNARFATLDLSRNAPA